MCGIAGILSTQSAPDIASVKQTASALKAMQAALLHRGPDGKGAYFSPSKHAALSHTRLSIIDLSDGGAQPMSLAQGRYTITFNGEIYNYKKLRTQLEEAGEEFESDSDTEVILKLYANKGKQCVHSLRGMFAFVIWDEQEQSAFAARDALGIKPLYYRDKDDLFVFASELRALLASGVSSCSLSARGVRSYLLRGSVAEPDTAIRDVKMLPAGAYLSWSVAQPKAKVNRYWKLQFKSKSMTRAKAIEVTRTSLEHSVRAHLVSDVPVGIFLSGGIDSTAILAWASKLSKEPINTYSIAFEDPEWNEGDIAQRVAQHFGANHTEFLMTPEIAKPLFESFLKAVDQPTIDGFNTYCVSKLASEKGEKVVLSGLGGDELFAGYKAFEVIPEMLQKSAKVARLSGVIDKLSAVLNKRLSPRQRRIADALSAPTSVAAAQKSLRGIFSNSEAQVLTEALCGKVPKQVEHSDPEHRTLADNISDIELSTYMRNQLLRDSDISSMAWGLELRVPFVDRVFIEQIEAIPSEVRLQYGKQLLIDSTPELPSWVVERPKQGFRFPFDQWFEDQWQSLPMPETPDWIELAPWYRRWSLLVLNDWKQRHAK